MAFEEHFQEHEIEAYLLNNLSADESIVIEEHIMICPTCVSKAEEVGSQIALIRHAFDSLREQKPSGALVDRPIAVFQNWLSVPLIGATAVLLLIANLSLLRTFSGPAVVKIAQVWTRPELQPPTLAIRLSPTPPTTAWEGSRIAPPKRAQPRRNGSPTVLVWHGPRQRFSPPATEPIGTMVELIYLPPPELFGNMTIPEIRVSTLYFPSPPRGRNEVLNVLSYPFRQLARFVRALT